VKDLTHMGPRKGDWSVENGAQIASVTLKQRALDFSFKNRSIGPFLFSDALSIIWQCE